MNQWQSPDNGCYLIPHYDITIANNGAAETEVAETKSECLRTFHENL